MSNFERFKWWLYNCKIVRQMSKIKWWAYHRLHPSHQYNVVKTGLPAGYYEVDERMLHACFNLLKDYIEKELAWFALICGDRSKVPWWQTLEQYRNKHYRTLSLGYLNYWENITAEEAEKEWILSPESLQSKRDQDREIRELYLWWIDVRPNRRDPFNVSDDQYVPRRAYIISEAYLKEDEEMLIRLMKVRTRLWT